MLVREVGGNVYHASGCGQSTEYTCSSFANTGSRAPCEERGVRGHEPVATPRSPAPDPAGAHAPPGPVH